MRAFASFQPQSFSGSLHARGATAHHFAGASRARAEAAAGIDQALDPNVPCVSEQEPIQSLRRLLVDRHAPAVTVIGRHGRPVGIVTRTDLLRALDDRAGRPQIAAEVMNALVYTLPITASVEQAAALMSYEGIQQIVITDLDGHVAGQVSALDIARHYAREAGYLV
jgi:CBS domain-containing protein